jgi:UDP-glucose 4-epimerase
LNKRLKITSPGTQVRNFTHIDDTIDALKLIAANGIGDDYGIANPKSYSINEVANLISENIEYVNENAANRLSSLIISEKTVNLGWAPKRELEEYIKSKI